MIRKIVGICCIITMVTSFGIGCNKEGPGERAGKKVDQTGKEIQKGAGAQKDTVLNKSGNQAQPGPGEKAGKQLDQAKEKTGKKAGETGKRAQEQSNKTIDSLQKKTQPK